MSERAYESFFLQPNDAVQRRYEVLRAVLVEQQPMREVGKYFEISYGTVRNWVSCLATISFPFLRLQRQLEFPG